MQIKSEIIINKPASAVWAIVGEQFGDIHVWASGLTHSQGSGKKLNDMVSESRSCDIKGMGHIQETLLAYDPTLLTLKYKVVKGFPFFIESGVNQWTLTNVGGATLVHTFAEIKTKGITGMLMAPMMKMQMTGIMRKAMEDLKYYAETGSPHPRKLKAQVAAKRAIA